jgi:hypothetical protein
MATLAQGQTNGAFAPELVFYAGNDAGHLVDLGALEFQIFRANDEASRIAPVQVYPTTPGTRAAVGLTLNSQDRLGIGRYVPAYTVASNEPVGLHEIRWFWRFVDQPEQQARKLFDVVAGGAAALGLGPSYALLSGLRAEGVPSAGWGSISDTRLQVSIVLASQYVNMITGRRFGPYYARQQLNGRSSRALFFGEPIIAIEAVGIDTAPNFRGDLAVEPELYRVFNRHLRGMIQPDDRENPHIEFVHSEDLLGMRGYAGSAAYGLSSLVWTSGVQNCDVFGVFGYTDPDGTPWGDIPGLISHAVKLLVFREMCLFWDVDCREDWRRRWQLTGERTRDQSYTLADPKTWGAFTGDPEIDTILARYMRPPTFGAV